MKRLLIPTLLSLVFCTPVQASPIWELAHTRDDTFQGKPEKHYWYVDIRSIYKAGKITYFKWKVVHKDMNGKPVYDSSLNSRAHDGRAPKANCEEYSLTMGGARSEEEEKKMLEFRMEYPEGEWWTDSEIEKQKRHATQMIAEVTGYSSIAEANRSSDALSEAIFSLVCRK